MITQGYVVYLGNITFQFDLQAKPQRGITPPTSHTEKASTGGSQLHHPPTAHKEETIGCCVLILLTCQPPLDGSLVDSWRMNMITEMKPPSDPRYQRTWGSNQETYPMRSCILRIRRPPPKRTPRGVGCITAKCIVATQQLVSCKRPAFSESK